MYKRRERTYHLHSSLIELESIQLNKRALQFNFWALFIYTKMNQRAV